MQVRERLHQPIELVVLDGQQPAIGDAGCRRGPRAVHQQRDLAEESAGGHGADGGPGTLDPKRALGDDVERRAGFALPHQDVASGELDLVGEHADRLETPLVDVREQRHASEEVELRIHGASIVADAAVLSRMSGLSQPIRAAVGALREAMANDGIRRLELAWLFGIGADMALSVVLLIVAYERGGVVAAGLLGAVRMVPAVASGMLAGTIVERFRGERVLAAIGLARAASAAGCAVIIALDGPLPALFALAAVAAAAEAPVRPIQATLMPAIARSPHELVAANTAWSTGEGIGGMLGPFLAGLFVAAGAPALAAATAP
jgi:hypothetical protein